MSAELTYLTWTAGLTAILWLPYILNMIMVRGLMDAVGYPEDPTPLAPWAARLKAAHYNAVENLVVFAALVLVAHLAQATNETTAMAAMIFFWARLVHAVAYALAIPFVRTLAFAAGFVAIVMILVQLL